MKLVWTPDPSVLGNNVAQKCLAGMPRFLNPANFVLDLQCDWSGTISIIKILRSTIYSLLVISRT